MEPIPSAPSLAASGRGEPFPYTPRAGFRDEVFAAPGQVAPAWQELFESCRRHGAEVLPRWRAIAARISRERGLAYRPESVNAGLEGHWTLDPIPWIIGAEEWLRIEAGVAQRMRLFATILQDLYGKRLTLERGLLPAELILGHRGFLRTLHNNGGLPPKIGLGMSGFDLAKDSSGQLFVLNDRFDRPYGLGVALENRTVVNKVLPNLFRRCQVRRIGHFFTTWFNYLASQAAEGIEHPRVVIVDSHADVGDSEISFLANYCGITRVEPSDLTVRDARVWLRALSGLEPVDVLWKTISGPEMDPLETRHTGAMGIAGLFEAMREGNVAIASHPGCEVLQSPGFYPFLPRLCKELLGEELVIPPVASWWCGSEKAKRYVLDNLEKMVIKSADHHADFPTCYGRRMSLAELAKLRVDIEATPSRYVGQEELAISTIPTSVGQELLPRGAVFRAFAFIDQNQIPHLMPGGMGRVSTADGKIVSTRDSGESKDVWVRALAPDAPVSIAQQVEQSRIISPEVVPSRTGENLFWAGRYAERTDAISRFATRIIEGRSAGYALDQNLEIEHEAMLIESLFSLYEVSDLLPRKALRSARLDLLVRGESCPVGVGRSLRSFHRSCMAAREQWSPRSLLAIDSATKGWFEGTEGQDSPFGYQTELEVLQLNLAAFLGLNLDSMTRDEGWALLDAGRRMERMFVMVGLLNEVLTNDVLGPMGILLNESVLFVSDSLRTYQSKFLNVPTTALTLLLLLGEEDYPRSLRFLLERLRSDLAKLPTPSNRVHPLDLVVPMEMELKAFLAVHYEGNVGKEGLEQAARPFLRSCLEQLVELSDLITKSYFSHPGNPT